MEDRYSRFVLQTGVKICNIRVYISINSLETFTNYIINRGIDVEI